MDGQGSGLRRGWTTGACATAAAKAAFVAWRGGAFPDPVEITLPRGERVAFALAESALLADGARASVVKDAGDDPDVTHGALISARVWQAPAGSGVQFRAGSGVGVVTRPGLPLAVGEPAINPVPRQMITAALAEVASAAPDAVVEISVRDGERLAERTMNARLGIVGGLSILGTTGIVIPYSCAAWIASIHRAIDVARAAGLTHVAGCTGKTSEDAVRRHHAMPDMALIEMGDFVGGMLKYLRTHPIPRVTVAGGIGKITKLAQGRLDLHSKRGRVDTEALAELAGGDAALRAAIRGANTAAEAFAHAEAAGVALAAAVARQAWETVARVLEGTGIAAEILIFGADGVLSGGTDGFYSAHAPPPAVTGRNRRG